MHLVIVGPAERVHMVSQFFVQNHFQIADDELLIPVCISRLYCFSVNRKHAEHVPGQINHVFVRFKQVD